ncbi:receptor-type protein kinase, putative [Bodo saltans]|uniref:Receptor-type protein kinase, putative n=1 Tax=Bodo saltans TaxID=75058 RepID=A0A0S4JJW9_BODSA|nr:receptor-type protein kinase, putative [Bodo saltans]|eukprot:CUG91767.1 receptor-type protein kinase, putative [Bodo saltans]
MSYCTVKRRGHKNQQHRSPRSVRNLCHLVVSWNHHVRKPHHEEELPVASITDSGVAYVACIQGLKELHFLGHSCHYKFDSLPPAAAVGAPPEQLLFQRLSSLPLLHTLNVACSLELICSESLQYIGLLARSLRCLTLGDAVSLHWCNPSTSITWLRSRMMHLSTLLRQTLRTLKLFLPVVSTDDLLNIAMLFQLRRLEITSFSLKTTKPSGSSSEVVEQVLAPLQHLEHLKIDQCCPLAGRLLLPPAALSQLTCLSITNNWRLTHLHVAMMPHFTNSHNLNSNITNLDLSGCEDVDDQCAAYIRLLTNLASLNIRETALTDVGIEELFTPPLAYLARLSLGGRSRIADISNAAMEIFALLPKLRTLEIFRCSDITNDGLTILGLDSPNSFYSLRFLTIENCPHVTRRGIEQLRAAKPYLSLNSSDPSTSQLPCSDSGMIEDSS